MAHSNNKPLRSRCGAVAADVVGDAVEKGSGHQAVADENSKPVLKFEQRRTSFLVVALWSSLVGFPSESPQDFD